MFSSCLNLFLTESRNYCHLVLKNTRLVYLLQENLSEYLISSMFTYPKIPFRRILLHLLFWLTVFAINYKNVEIMGMKEFYWVFVLWIMPIELAAVYFTAYFLVPKFLITRRYTLFLITLLGSAILFVLLERWIYYDFLFPRHFPDGRNRPFLFLPELWNIAVTMYAFVFLFSGVRLYRTWVQDLQHQTELEKQNLKSELTLLRAQVNPHFLFNTLNNIDQLVFKNQHKASDSIVKLSEIMRYMLYESTTELVPLEKEIKYLQSMVDLIRLRIKDPNFIEFTVHGDIKDKSIPPMLLVPFVENAYKHGKKSGQSPGIIITLMVEPKTYHFTVTNRIDNRSVTRKDKIGGIGLANVKRRIKLLYGDAGVLKLKEDEQTFRVDMRFPAQLT